MLLNPLIRSHLLDHAHQRAQLLLLARDFLADQLGLKSFNLRLASFDLSLTFCRRSMLINLAADCLELSTVSLPGLLLFQLDLQFLHLFT